MRVLHLHSSFNPGGKELRAAKLIGAFGPGISHSIVSGVPGALGAADAIDPAMKVDYPDFPPLAGRLSPGRLRQIAEGMRGFDLVLTYNWGAMDAVMAHRLHARRLGLPALVHHEDGFNQDEADGLKASRNWFRRIALPSAAALVVPSRLLERIALDAWKQPASRVQRISNGIAVADFARRPAPDAVAGLVKADDDLWLGTMAGLRAVKNLPRLVEAFAPLSAPWRLVILGEGPERAAIASAAERLGVADRVHLPGHVGDPAAVMGLFDLFALSSDSEQFPISVVEAMAAGVPVAAMDVGDIAAMVADENRPFVSGVTGTAGLGQAIAALAADAGLRAQVGAANRARAAAEYGEEDMVSAYRRLYARAAGRSDLP